MCYKQVVKKTKNNYYNVTSFPRDHDNFAKMSTGKEGGAFGAGKAGTPFDPVAFIKKPQVILRIAGTVCSPFPLHKVYIDTTAFGCMQSNIPA